MSFTFKAAERLRRRGAKTTLQRRPDTELPFLGTQPRAGGPLLLDTCVYIDQMQGRAPPLIEDLLALRIVNHSTIAIQELMHAVGAVDPDDARSGRVIAAIGTAIDGMPSHRVFTPDADVLGQAALYAGMLCRLQGYARDDRMGALHDCVLFLQALKLGFYVLTRNVREFDLLLQLRQEGRVLFYRT
ncbi:MULTISPECIES: type II toxin-antitoxin system VapC family toxin [unclassified Methylobacterium]|jgi:predicted nucleic acid-binding protein|uniref:type II toxin-antitoxin system VapC family toxin n=1 Tax=unclassified Methylobacterium TaxID=2615210 RepID=UPI001354B09C|nr:type II toxin-antitoxin system VapC family toxin [Methylobacterium sp. 2A]MWV23005.1 type II toxin-antitoxin system VapC family toxin [Methylobacterium sp. 2A]